MWLSQTMADTTVALNCVATQRTQEIGEAQGCAEGAAELLGQGRVQLRSLAAELRAAGISAAVTADDLSEFQDQVRQNGLPAGWLIEDPAMKSSLQEAILDLTTKDVTGLPSVFTNSRNQKDLKLEIEALTKFSKVKTETPQKNETFQQELLPLLDSPP